MIIYDKDILTGRICPYCRNQPEFVDSAIVYGKSYGMIYLCRPCHAWVGVHKGTDTPLGSLANNELRKIRKIAHHYFDQISRTSLINKIWPLYIEGISNRNKAYLWLSEKLFIPKEYCHIGMMNIEQCKKVIQISKEELLFQRILNRNNNALRP